MNNFEVKDNSKEIVSFIQIRLRQALNSIGGQAVKNAADLTPVVTSNLKNSITYEINEEEKYVIIGTNVEYAPSVELGSSRNRHPKHMLKKAATEYTDQYKKIAEDAFKKA